MASTTLSITYGSAGNRNKWTWSAWVKRSKLGGHQSLFTRYADSNNIGDLRFQSDDGFTYQNYNNGSTNAQWNASQKFRDTNAWYHIVFVWDTGQATASDRIKVYVNGEDMAGSANAVPSQNTNSLINASASHKIGSRNSDQYFDGSMTHIHFCDGYAYSPTDFGETDSTTGIWKPKTSPSVSYGTNGFFLDMANSSDMGNDVSGNNNDLTVSGTITQTIDTPSNVFATLNPLAYRLDAGVSLPTYSNGNTTVSYASDGGAGKSSMATLCFTSGKWYWEYKVNSANDTVFGGITRADYDPNDNFAGRSIYYNKTGALSVGTGTGGTANGSYGNSYTTGDIISVAFDCDNGVIWFAKNGTWQNSATQAEIEAGTTTNSATTGITLNQFWSPFLEGADSGMSINFGNGYFGTTAVASAGTNSGIGTFEYDVPSGYKALCTKNINAEEYS